MLLGEVDDLVALGRVSIALGRCVVCNVAVGRSVVCNVALGPVSCALGRVGCALGRALGRDGSVCEIHS